MLPVALALRLAHTCYRLLQTPERRFRRLGEVINSSIPGEVAPASSLAADTITQLVISWFPRDDLMPRIDQ